jgi:hypothetical protein
MPHDKVVGSKVLIPFVGSSELKYGILFDVETDGRGDGL